MSHAHLCKSKNKLSQAKIHNSFKIEREFVKDTLFTYLHMDNLYIKLFVQLQSESYSIVLLPTKIVQMMKTIIH